MHQFQERKRLRYLLRNYYHQDVWDDYKTHRDVWEAFVHNEVEDSVAELRNDVKELLAYNPEEVHRYINEENNGGLWLKTVDDVQKWLEALEEFLSKQKSS